MEDSLDFCAQWVFSIFKSYCLLLFLFISVSGWFYFFRIIRLLVCLLLLLLLILSRVFGEQEHLSVFLIFPHPRRKETGFCSVASLEDLFPTITKKNLPDLNTEHNTARLSSNSKAEKTKFSHDAFAHCTTNGDLLKNKMIGCCFVPHIQII